MAVVQYLKRVGKYFIPAPHKSDDGRDQWPSRLAYLLATMGGVAGQGNLIRYPSVAYNNYGLQWFIPYLMAVLFIATPTMILETAIGQAYRGGTVIAFNNINRRLRGVGFGSVFISFIVVQYFTVIVAWIMHYFRTSFTSPLPWEGRIQEFYADDVIANPPAIPGSLTDGNRQVAAYTQYPSVGMVAETVGWAAFLWFLVWISIFRGVTVTGRVAYFGMGLPIVTTIIMVGRSLSLENAGQGVRLLWGTWRGDQLRTGALWQTAVGQVFFSTGVGFGYFTTYASYNNTKHTNTVLDAILICASNVLFENVAALAIFGLIGYLRLWPQDGVRLGAFVVGFLTLPEAVLQMPGSNFWAILLFLTLAVLGFTSSFVMLDVAVTLVTDTGVRLHRTWVVTALTMTCFLMCLPYCTQFGLALLDGVDWWISNVALIFVVWAELVSATTVYRWTDVVSQTGLPAFVVYNIAYFGAQLAGLCVAHGIQNPSAGAGVGFGIYVLGAVAAVILSRAPDSSARGFWSRNTYLSRFWYLAFYSVSPRLLNPGFRLSWKEEVS